MPEFFDYNPTTGITETWDYDEATGKASIHHSADVSPFLKRNAEARADKLHDKGLMDGGREFHFYASLTPVVQIELRAKGIDIYSKDPAMIRRMFREINAHYPLCKVTDKHHA